MKRQLLILSAFFILMSCGKGSDNGKSGGGTTAPAPGKALLTFPDQSAVCTSGTVISDTESSITFTWSPSDNTESYELDIKNLLAGTTTTQNTSQPQFTATLLRNTPYSWYIVSKSTKTSATTQSDVWKFYNAGKGTISYAPFPAQLTSPTLGQNVTATAGAINLTWTGSSVLAGTISGYDVYLGTTVTPSLLKSDVTDSFLNNVSVASQTTYYWKVVTKDIIGNTSSSEVYQFTVN